MYCENCGNKINNTGKFCGGCGDSISSHGNGAINTKKKSSQSTEELEQASYFLLIEQAKKTANAEMMKGIGWAGIGLLITFITYSMATDGGTYFVFWGLVIYGVYIFFKRSISAYITKESCG